MLNLNCLQIPSQEYSFQIQPITPTRAYAILKEAFPVEYENNDQYIHSITQDLKECALLSNENIKNIKRNVLQYAFEYSTQYDKSTASVLKILNMRGLLDQPMLDLVLQHDLDDVADIISALNNTKQVKDFMVKDELSNIFRCQADAIPPLQRQFSIIELSPNMRPSMNFFRNTSGVVTVVPKIEIDYSRCTANAITESIMENVDNTIQNIAEFLTAYKDLKLLASLSLDQLHIISKHADSGFIAIAEALLKAKHLHGDAFSEMVFHPNAGGAKNIQEILESLKKQALDGLITLDAGKLQVVQDYLRESSYVHYKFSGEMELIETKEYIIEKLDKARVLNYPEMSVLIEHADSVECIFQYIKDINAFHAFDLLQDPATAADNLISICKYIDVINDNGIMSITSNNEDLIFDQDLFDEIIECCENHATKEQRINAVIAYLNHVIQGDNIFNPAESTHTPSIQASIADAVQKLNKRYGERLKEESVLEQILDHINDQVGALTVEKISKNTTEITQQMRNGAAQRYFKALKATHYEADFFENDFEGDSGIDLKTLVGLVWCAANDTECYTGDDPLHSVVVQAAYEIQRGKNLDEFNVDDKREDDTICPLGSFEKWGEILWSRHPDVNLEYFSRTTVHAKLVALVRSEAVDYLTGVIHQHIDTVDIFDELDKVKENGIGASIWEQIQHQVKAKVAEKAEVNGKQQMNVLEEYDLIPDKKNSPKENWDSFYATFVGSAKSVELIERDHHVLQKALLKSAGYKKYLSNSILQSNVPHIAGNTRTPSKHSLNGADNGGHIQKKIMRSPTELA